MVFALGAQVPLSWTPLSTQASAAVTVYLPDGTTSSPAVAGTTTFTATYTPTLVGRHEVFWQGSGGSPTRTFGPDAFEVTAKTRAPLVGLSDAKEHLGLSSTTAYDAQLLAMLASVSDAVETELGRPARLATFVDSFSGRWRSSLLLRQNPCPCLTCAPFRSFSITSVVEDAVTLSATDYTLNSNSGVISRGQLSQVLFWSDRAMENVVVTYKAGYTGSPSWLRLAVLRAIENTWTRTQQRPHPGMGQGPDTDFTPATAFTLPYAVQALIESHKGVGAA
jgi:hypothetical protein